MNVPGRYSRPTQVGGVSVCVCVLEPPLHPDPFRAKLATSQPQHSSAERGESVWWHTYYTEFLAPISIKLCAD